MLGKLQSVTFGVSRVPDVCYTGCEAVLTNVLRLFVR